MFSIITILVPAAVELLKLYFRNSDTKHDDKILETIQEGCRYLQPLNNNTVDNVAVNVTNSHVMVEGV